MSTNGKLASDKLANDERIRGEVRQGYARVAVGTTNGCCGMPGAMPAHEFAAQIGYAAADLAAVPEGANMALSCGNPALIAALKPGEVVLDLGSGGGFDVFLAGPRVGATGRVIGVDMTPEMIAKARGGIGWYRGQSGLDNVEFRLGEIEHLPVADGSVDVVISNCVINLSPDKPQVFREIARVLKPGGRVAASDMALLRPLPQAVEQEIVAWVGCIAGAVLIDDYRRALEAAGLEDVTLNPKSEYVAAMQQFEDPLYRRIMESLPAGTTPVDFFTSVDVAGRKP